MAMHEDQLEVRVDTVRRLVKEQFPQWENLAVREMPTAGTVNAIFRIGDELAARFPLRAQDPTQVRAWLRSEAAAADELADISSVPTPEPVAIGEPGHGYPLPWSVQTWLPGSVATVDDPAGSVEFAADLAAFIAALRATDTRGRRFDGEGRGGHLPDHDEWMDVCFRQSEGLLDVVRLRAMWADLRTLPEVDGHRMCHGDLTPPNVLVRDRRLVGVLDGGGFAQPIRRSTSSAGGISSTTFSGRSSGKAWAAARFSGAGAWRGPSNSRWALFGTTPSRTRA